MVIAKMSELGMSDSSAAGSSQIPEEPQQPLYANTGNGEDGTNANSATADLENNTIPVSLRRKTNLPLLAINSTYTWRE